MQPSIAPTALPSVLSYHYENAREDGEPMEFRLTYAGPLPANGDATAKQEIRLALHPQLRELWRTDVHLSQWPNSALDGWKRDELAANYLIAEHSFVPLISEKFGLMCSLDILFLRRGDIGDVVKTGGDLDNRVKTLLDALRTPNNRDECGRILPTDDQKPCYTLMTNDALIADIRVETDRLLQPTSLTGRAALNNVELVIKVKTRIVDYFKGHPYPHFA